MEYHLRQNDAKTKPNCFSRLFWWPQQFSSPLSSSLSASPPPCVVVTVLFFQINITRETFWCQISHPQKSILWHFFVVVFSGYLTRGPLIKKLIHVCPGCFYFILFFTRRGGTSRCFQGDKDNVSGFLEFRLPKGDKQMEKSAVWPVSSHPTPTIPPSRCRLDFSPLSLVFCIFWLSAELLLYLFLHSCLQKCHLSDPCSTITTQNVKEMTQLWPRLPRTGV